jgi:FHA domain
VWIEDSSANGTFIDGSRVEKQAVLRAGDTIRLGSNPASTFTYADGQAGSVPSVSPDHIFHSGDRVRILVETNRQVYLCVFHQEGPGPADLLFPDARLRGGENIVRRISLRSSRPAAGLSLTTTPAMKS